MADVDPLPAGRAEDLQRAGELITASINELCERHRW
jgi:hypothetical protein